MEQLQLFSTLSSASMTAIKTDDGWSVVLCLWAAPGDRSPASTLRCEALTAAELIDVIAVSLLD